MNNVFPLLTRLCFKLTDTHTSDKNNFVTSGPRVSAQRGKIRNLDSVSFGQGYRSF